MRKILIGLAGAVLALTSIADGASAYERQRRYKRPRLPTYTYTENGARVSKYEGIPRYGRIGSTMPHPGTPTGHENAASIGDVQLR